MTRPGGERVDISYDSGGRPSRLTHPDGETSYSYDPTSGNLASVSSPGGSLSYTYDGFLPTSETLSGEVSGKVSLKYDNSFRVTSLGVNSETPITYSYDSDDLITGAGTLSLTRDPKNGLITGTRLNYLSDSRTYNSFGELAGYKATFQGAYGSTPEEWFASSYERDNAGRITKKTETVGDITSTYTYRYDAADRLAEVKKDGQTVGSYTYDQNGNRLNATTATGGTVEATYDNQDRLLKYGGISYSYSPSGELSSKTDGGQSTAYDYDALGNLKSVSLPDGRKVQYVVDGNDRRVGKKVDGKLTQGFLYYNDEAVAAELDASGKIISRFVYATKSNVPDYMIRNGVTYRIVSDYLGSPRLVVNAQSGEIVQRMDYDEFGSVVLDSNPGFQPFGFAGGLYDRDTGLVRFGARDYDPETGRWTAKDPIGFAGGDTNLYANVLPDPVMRPVCRC